MRGEYFWYEEAEKERNVGVIVLRKNEGRILLVCRDRRKEARKKRGGGVRIGGIL